MKNLKYCEKFEISLEISETFLSGYSKYLNNLCVLKTATIQFLITSYFELYVLVFIMSVFTCMTPSEQEELLQGCLHRKGYGKQCIAVLFNLKVFRSVHIFLKHSFVINKAQKCYAKAIILLTQFTRQQMHYLLTWLKVLNLH